MENLENQDIQTRLDFGGFYESIHASLIDDAIALRLDAQSRYELSEEQENLIDQKALEREYCELYLENFQQYLKENHALEITLNFEELFSPKEYNFSTDAIDYKLSQQDAEKCFEFFKSFFAENEDFQKYCQNLTTSRSGFWAFYELEDVQENKDVKAVEFILNYLAIEANNEPAFLEDLNLFENLQSLWTFKDLRGEKWQKVEDFLVSLNDSFDLISLSGDYYELEGKFKDMILNIDDDDKCKLMDLTGREAFSLILEKLDAPSEREELQVAKTKIETFFDDLNPKVSKSQNETT